jgi:hypothetical protein
MPHRLDKCVFADETAPMLDQVLQDFVGLRPEMDRLAAAQQAPPSHVQRELIEELEPFISHGL